jgi:CHASE2 domain-containing sensor protein
MKNFRWVVAFFLYSTAVMGYLSLNGSFRNLEGTTLDWRFRLFRQNVVDDSVVLVGITDDCIRELGEWPFSRAAYAKAISFLDQAGASAIGLDILFEAPSASDPAGDLAFLKAARNCKKLVVPGIFLEQKSVDPDSREVIYSEDFGSPFPALASSVKAIGYGNGDFLHLNPGGVFRYLFLSHFSAGEWFPSFSLALARTARGKPQEPNPEELMDNRFQGVAHFPPWERIPGIWSSDRSKVFPVNYRKRIRIVSFADLVSGALSPESFRNRSVIIGPMAPGLGDFWVTPIGLIPGAQIHATVLGNLLSGEILHDVPPAIEVLIIGLLNGLAIWVAGSSLSVLTGLLAFLGILSGYFLLGLLVFQNSVLILPLVAPIFSGGIVFGLGRFMQFSLDLMQANQRLQNLNVQLTDTNSQLEGKVLELSILNKAGSDFQSTLNLDQLAQNILQTFVELRGAKNGFLVLENERELQLLSVCGENAPNPEEIPQREDLRTIFGQYKNGQNPSTTDGIDWNRSFPLTISGKLLGAIFLKEDSAPKLTTAGAGFWDTLLGISGTALENARLFEISAEVTAARMIQQDLVPSEALQIGEYQVFGLSQPATQMGGDFFDYAKVGESHAAVFIADVVGHGVPAAIGTAMIKAAFLQFIGNRQTPEEFLTNLNSILYQAKNRRTVAASVLLWLDFHSHQHQVFFIGGVPPLFFPAGKAGTYLKWASGLILGIRSQPIIKKGTFTMAPGDRLLLVTDGLIEAFSEDESADKFIMFLQWVKLFIDLPFLRINPSVFAQHPWNSVGKPQPDDFTMVTLARRLPELT